MIKEIKRTLFVTFFSSCVVGVVAQTQIIAHRGYWKCDNSAQNSIVALKKACTLGIYGSEFDVRLSSDSVPIVFHDGSKGEVKISRATAAELSQVKLGNGEVIPTLQQYLQVGKTCKNTKLILEIKTDKETELALTARIVAMVKKMKIQKRVEYISFSEVACREVIRLDPKAAVYYLGGKLSPQELKTLGFAGMDYHMDVIRKYPVWVKEAHELGLKVNVWTVNKKEDVAYLRELGVDFITTDHPEEFRDLLLN